MKKIAIWGMIICLTLTWFSVPAEATNKSKSELQKEKEEVSGEIKDTESQLENLKAEMSKVESEIRALDDKLVIAADELETVNQTLADTKANLAQTETELSEAHANRDEQFDVFKTRLRVMHELGSVSYLEVLFKATSVRDFLTRLEYMNYVAKYDQQLVERMEAAEDKVSEKVEEIARQKNIIENLLYTQTKTMENMQVLLDNRKVYFEELDADEQRYQAKLEIQKADEKAIMELIKQKEKEEEEARKRAQQSAQQRAAAVPYGGRMLWPLASYTYISDTYRQRIHPITKKTDFHTGVDIASPMGTSIFAADSGEVILSKYYGGYGYCVIISHGGGISTLYAHASKLLVSVGQRVNKGDVIAKVGSTGSSTGPHLHFEVLINGAHTNPKAYLNY